MRFRFCGDLDCPDWILAEINTLARVTSVKMKLVCQQVVKSLLGEDIDFDRVKKLTADAKFGYKKFCPEVGGSVVLLHIEPSEVKATVAALLFVLETSARHGVDGETLGSELQQLGLPREHAAALCRVYSDNLTSISSRLQDQSLRLSRLQDVQWRMDTVVVDKNQMVGELRVGLRVFCPASGTHHTHNFNIGAQQLHLLLADLKRAASLMEPL